MGGRSRLLPWLPPLVRLMATPPWMPDEFGNDAVLIAAQRDLINELRRKLEKSERDRRRYFARLEAIRNLVTTKHEAMAQFISRVRACLYQKHF